MADEGCCPDCGAVMSEDDEGFECPVCAAYVFARKERPAPVCEDEGDLTHSVVDKRFYVLGSKTVGEITEGEVLEFVTLRKLKRAS